MHHPRSDIRSSAEMLFTVVPPFGFVRGQNGGVGYETVHNRVLNCLWLQRRMCGTDRHRWWTRILPRVVDLFLLIYHRACSSRVGQRANKHHPSSENERVIPVTPKVPYAQAQADSLSNRENHARRNGRSRLVDNQEMGSGKSGRFSPRTAVSLLTPETHATCVSRFIAKKIYVDDVGDPTERLLKPWITSFRRNMKMGNERRCWNTCQR